MYRDDPLPFRLQAKPVTVLPELSQAEMLPLLRIVLSSLIYSLQGIEEADQGKRHKPAADASRNTSTVRKLSSQSSYSPCK